MIFPNLVPTNDDIFDESGSVVTDSLSCDSGGSCYIVAGSDKNVVKVTVNHVDLGSDAQNKLENAAANTDNLAYNTVFSPFPGAESFDPRNPVYWWAQDYGN